MREQQATWEAIAASFDQSRSRAWPHVEAYAKDLPAGPILDLMGGNGRHLPALAGNGRTVVWTDFSRPAARMVAQRYPGVHAVVADAGHLPFPDASFAGCVFAAGLHAVPDAAHRHLVLRELARVLRPDATAQVTVWSREGPKFAPLGTRGEPLDIVIPWRSHGHDEKRPTHLFTAQSLRRDLEAAGLQVLELGEQAIVGPRDNIVAVVRPLPTAH